MASNLVSEPAFNSKNAQKYARGDKLAQFSANGKTFFFNKFLSKNDTPYLAINALYGKGSRERIILFESHYLEFLRCLKVAISELTGLKFDEPQPQPQEVVECPKFCPSCNFDLLAYYEETSR